MNRQVIEKQGPLMTEMIEVLRGYESYQKVIRTIDDANAKAINEVGNLALNLERKTLMRRRSNDTQFMDGRIRNAGPIAEHRCHL